MQEPTKESTFCAVCRHPTGVGDGHYKNCPVYTGEPVRGISFSHQQSYIGINPQSLQPVPSQQEPQPMYPGMAAGGVVCPYCGGMNGLHVWAGQGGCPALRTHHSTYQENLEPHLLAELRTVTQCNRSLSKALLEALLEVAKLKAREGA